MGKSQKAPPPPDYSGVAAASAQSAQYSYELGKEQLAWAKKTYASDKATTDRIVNAALEVQARNDATAAKDRARYETTYQPIEDAFIKQVEDFNSPGRQEANAGRAAADVSSNFEAARRASQAQLEAYGVDPSQTRAHALDLSTRTQEAAARAGASNTARLQTETQGMALRGSAIDIGKGYPSQVAQQYNTGLQAGNQAGNMTLAQTQTGAQTMGTGTQWQGLGNQAVGTWGNTLTQGYNTQMQQYQANQNRSSGLGSLLGLGVGLGTKMLTGGLFEEGGRVPTPEEMAAGSAPRQGIPVSAHMSPSGGAETDDVPARLNAGEFVVPKETLMWYGEKHFQKLIEKGQQEQAQAGAKPQVGALPVETPAVRSPALPV